MFARSRQRGHWAWWLIPGLLLIAATVWWTLADAQPTATLQQDAQRAIAAAVPPRGAASASPASASGAPFSAAGLQARQAQRELWQQRVARAQATLDAYRQSTRYPHESQPISEHPDQVYPNQPIVEEQALRMTGGKAGADAPRLRTTQERVFVQGNETVRFSVSLQDSAGRTLPLRIVRASAHEVPPPGTASLYPDVAMDFNDEGQSGDAAAGDGVFGVALQPAAQGFAGLLGQIRVEVFLQHGQQQGFTYFDIVYTAEPPAVWQAGVREALHDGSLSFDLKAVVRESGRYVVTGRLDDADGKPFALLSFNEEVAAGVQEIRLTLFGKLVRDAKPAFPLTLRDVDAFLLRPDTFPDRKLMPRLAGPVHVSKDYPLASFADTEWTSEERSRYLAELSRDLTEAQARVEQLGTGP
jgi:hypothetical protein